MIRTFTLASVSVAALACAAPVAFAQQAPAREQRDQVIVLAVALFLNSDEHAISERHRVRPGFGRRLGKVGAGRVEHPPLELSHRS